MKRVVVTGIGSMLPCGDDIFTAWNDVLNCSSWVKKNDKFDVSNYKSQVCAGVYLDDDVREKYDFLISSKDNRRLDDVEYVAIIASYQAMKDCDLIDKDFDKTKFGTFIASGIGGIKTIQNTAKTLIEKGNRKISPFFLTSSLVNMCSGNVAIKFGLQGASMSHVSACASSTHAIGEAFNKIRNGVLNGCLAGGSEMAVCELGIGGFDAINALSTKYNDNPSVASRALDKDRDGFVMGEGSVVFMLEELEHAKNRNAKIYCEIVGYGASCDAFHITSPNPEGDGATMAMNNAIKDACISANDIDYINLHGTSTPAGDVAEIKAIKKTFKEQYSKVAISSSKSVSGHLLGASGALEAMLCVKSLETQTLIPSANIENLDDCCVDMNVIREAKKSDIKYVMSNSFGFGGTNACLVFKRYDSDK